MNLDISKESKDNLNITGYGFIRKDPPKLLTLKTYFFK
jgi:hypothetical protein